MDQAQEKKKKKKKDLISFRKSIETCMKYRKVIAQED